MAFTTKHWLLALVLICICIFNFKFGNSDDGLPNTGSRVDDPAQIVAKALLCFNDKLIYIGCDEAYRLNARGDLNVPPEYTDQFCSGPCLAETNLVLNCVDSILSHFQFYNKATIRDVRDTIKAGCSYGSQRGDFNVANHTQVEGSKADKITISTLFNLVLIIIVSIYYFFCADMS